MSRPESIAEARERWGTGRPDMMAGAVPYYENDYSVYPEKIRTLFRDGSTRVYRLEEENPPEVILENIRIIRRMKQICHPARRRYRK